MAVVLRGRTAEIGAGRAALRLADARRAELVVLVPVARPNLEAEFAAGLRSSALTRQIEEEMRARVARLLAESRASLRHEVVPCPRPLLDSAPRLAAELGCEILAIPRPRSRALHWWLIGSRARRLGVRLVTLDHHAP